MLDRAAERDQRRLAQHVRAQVAERRGDRGVDRRPVATRRRLSRARSIAAGDREPPVAIGLHAAQRLDVLGRIAPVAAGRAVRQREAEPLLPHADRPGGDAGLLRHVLDRQCVHAQHPMGKVQRRVERPSPTVAVRTVGFRRSRGPYHRATHEPSARTAPGGGPRRGPLRDRLEAGQAHPRPARRRSGRPSISALHDDTSVDRSGAVRSVQSADVEMPVAALAAIWSPMHLERLARTYWRFLSRCTLGPGARRVHRGRTLRRAASAARSSCWRSAARVRDGRRPRGRALADRARRARRAAGRRRRRLPRDRRQALADERPRARRLHVEVEVANYYPRIASTFTQWAYAVTQSRIHVLVTYGFLRSIAKLDLAPVEGRALRRDRRGAGPQRPDAQPAVRQARRRSRSLGDLTVAEHPLGQATAQVIAFGIGVAISPLAMPTGSARWRADGRSAVALADHASAASRGCAAR